MKRLLRNMRRWPADPLILEYFTRNFVFLYYKSFNEYGGVICKNIAEL